MISTPSALYAGFWRRVGAAFADALLLGLLSVSFTAAGIDARDPWISLAISTVVDWLYFAGFHASRWQATPGKRAFGIKVTDLRGERIGFLRATGRYFASCLSALLLCIGYLMAAWTARKQALHDKLADTVVVDDGAAPQDVPMAAGVMPLPGRSVAAIVFFGIALGAATTASVWLADDEEPAAAVTSATPEKQESLSYEIQTVPFFGDGARRAVAEGMRSYRHSEVRARPHSDPETRMTSKSVSLAEGFDLIAVVVPGAQVDGFGLQIKRNGAGFSWEWFDREAGDVYRKLQGPGRLRVRFRDAGGLQELAEVHFLDDVTLRLDRWWFLPFMRDKSDHVVVKKGSVLWLAD